MFHRWSDIIIRRARLVLALGILATIFAGVAALDDAGGEAAAGLSHGAGRSGEGNIHRLISGECSSQRRGLSRA